jgi:hypothetical protein
VPGGYGSNCSFIICVELLGGYRFGGNSYEIFESFFGSSNPWVDKLEFDGSD